MRKPKEAAPPAPIDPRLVAALEAVAAFIGAFGPLEAEAEAARQQALATIGGLKA